LLVEDNLVLKSTFAKSRKKLLDYWSYVIILSNLIHIEIAISNISSNNSELNYSTLFIGAASLLSCWSLNTYLMIMPDYSYLPATIIFSSREVFNGLVGIFPLMIGLAIYSSTMLGDHFRFKDPANAFMTMFYITFGDTMFDTITGIRQVSFFFTLFWSYLWSWFGNNIIINITLAQVEHGYLKQKA
jgi:hypothetical protein